MFNAMPPLRIHVEPTYLKNAQNILIKPLKNWKPRVRCLKNRILKPWISVWFFWDPKRFFIPCFYSSKKVYSFSHLFFWKKITTNCPTFSLACYFKTLKNSLWKHGQVLTNTKRCLLRNFLALKKNLSAKIVIPLMNKVFRYHKPSETPKRRLTKSVGTLRQNFLRKTRYPTALRHKVLR